MRVLVAPDAFAGTLTAPEAARAVAEGWARQAPDDELTTLPMADGGPGFVDVLHDSLGGDLEVVTVSGPLGRPTPVTLLMSDGTAFVESAQACGHPLLDEPDPWNSTTAGVGEAVAAAVDAGASKVVVGLGGSAHQRRGAGLLGALGATADVPLDAGPAGLRGITSVDLAPARERLDGVALVAAIDVDTQLLGMFGATKTYGPQKGLAEDEILVVDRILDELVVAACGSAPADRRVAEQAGAGAAGGLGFALMLLGATTRPGVDFVSDAVGLAAACAGARPRRHGGGHVRPHLPQRQGRARRGHCCGLGRPAVHRARRPGDRRGARDACHGRGVRLRGCRPRRYRPRA